MAAVRFTKSMKYLSEVIVPKLLYTTTGICITSALLYLLILSLSMEEPSPTWLIAIIGITAATVWASVIIVKHQCWSTTLCLPSALFLIFNNLRANYIGKKALKCFKSKCFDVKNSQERLLLEIVNKNNNTEYGRKFHLSRINSLESLKRYHPLTVYKHYEDFINRVADGELFVMTKDIPSRLCHTSGTTGQNKLIPQDIKKLLPKVRAVIKGTSLETFPKVTIMQRIMKLHIHYDFKKSKSGIPIAVATAIEPKTMKRLVSYTTPPEGLLLGDMFEAMYIHLLFGIKERSLGVIEASFISTFEETIRILLANWQLLVDDLANGTISETLQLDNNTRRALTAALGMGDPERAREVEREVKKGPIGIVKRIWPLIGYIGCIDNIGRKLYLETTVAKGVTIYSYGYGSSEGAQGVNLWPNDTEVSFLPYHEVAVFEFIPENEIDVESPETVFLHELEVGKIYEIVVTQACGLYRYRMGDVVQVVGYFGECPRVKFFYRTAMLLSINNEKVSQAVVSAALKEAMGNWPNVSLEHFCVAESPLSPRLVDEKHTGCKHFYTFFLDIRSQSDELQLQDAIDIKILPKLIDDGISSRHKRFESELRSKRLDPSKVFLVNSKAFWNLRQYILRIGQISAVQVKLPEKLRTPQMVDIMMSHVM